LSLRKPYKHEKSNKHNYSLKVSIDTMILVAKLTHEQREKLFNRIMFHPKNLYEDQHFKFSRKLKNIVLKAKPRNPLTSINYDVMLIIEKNTSLTDVPYSIKEILQFDTWKIKRMDIAFDFSNNTPFSTFPNRLIMKHHGNVKFLQQNNNDKDWKSEYIGSLSSKTEAKACCYDRNEKEIDRGTGIVHDCPLRFEIRLYPKLNEYNSIRNIDHGWIESKLSKFIFIPDIEQLPFNKWDKRRLYKIQENYVFLKTLKETKQRELKKRILKHRVQFEDIYINNKKNLFSFLIFEKLVIENDFDISEQIVFNYKNKEVSEVKEYTFQ
jgi:hypothetical protein